MRLTINGKEQEITGADTVADLLRRFELLPVRVAVEVNEELVPRATFESAALNNGDAVEIVTLVGGG